MVATGVCLPRRRPGERPLLEGEVSVQVHLGGLDRLVPEPEGDDSAIDAAPEQLHRRGVAQHVGSHALLLKGRAALAGRGGVLRVRPFGEVV